MTIFTKNIIRMLALSGFVSPHLLTAQQVTPPKPAANATALDPVASAQAQSWRSIIQKVKPSVFCLRMLNEKTRQEKSGTGFIIQPTNGVDCSYLVTNLHLARGNDKGWALNSEDAQYEVRGMVHADIRNDLAILEIGHVPFTSLDLALIEKPGPSLDVGDEVAVYGYPTYPDFLDGALSTGIVAAFVRERDKGTRKFINQFLQITAPISPGSSGSPVLDRTGMVVGVVTKLYNGVNGGLGIAAISGKVDSLMKQIEKWQTQKGYAIIELKYIREGFGYEDLLAVTDERFKDFSQADSLNQKGEKRKAIELLVKDHNDSALIKYHLGITLYELALQDDALKSLIRATELDPKYVEAWSMVGILALNQYRDAERENKPKPAERLDLAKRATRRAMELLPIAPTNYYYGETLLTSNDFPNAVKFLETAYQMNDEDPKIAAAYLYALAKVGQLDRAKELWPRVSQMSADFNPDQKKRVETVEKIIRPGR